MAARPAFVAAVRCRAAARAGAGPKAAITGWLMAEQSWLTHLMAARCMSCTATRRRLGSIALGFAYGVFHAAGPGHGKAVIASYMLANERSLKRGAAHGADGGAASGAGRDRARRRRRNCLQATASQMNHAADWLELASYCGVAAIGAWLVWRKGARSLQRSARHFERRRAMASTPAYAGGAWRAGVQPFRRRLSRRAARRHGEPADECGHAHAPDPAELDGPFSWRAAAGTVIAAGARPCSGRSWCWCSRWRKGCSPPGSRAAFAMAIGTAVTTGALAWMAVFAKSTAMRLAAGENSRVALVARGFEFTAALAVLALASRSCLARGVA